MNKFNSALLAAGLLLAHAGGALAADMTAEAYKAERARIATDYKAAKAACKSFSANAKDICMAEAKGKQSVSKADLEVAYKPSNKARYNASVAKAGADYGVAREKCDDKAGNEKDICIKEAKAARVAAKADAEALMKTANANQDANATSNEARAKAAGKGAAANREATVDKRDADYAVAKEKCDTFAGDAKTACLKEAQGRFGK